MGKLLSNLIYLIFEKFSTTLILLISNVVIIRYLGVEDFGRLAIFQLYYALAVTVSEFGIRRVYSSLKDPAREALIFSQAFYIKIASSLFFLSFAAIFLYYNNYDVIFYGLLIAFIASPFEIFTYHFEANLKNQILVKVRLTVSLALALLRIAICFSGPGNFIYLLFTYAFSNLLINIICVFLTKKHKMKITKVRSAASRGIIRKHLFSRSLFFWMSVVVVQLNMRTDQFMLSIMAGTASVGIYAGAYKLVEQLLSIPSLLAGVFLPYISKNKEIDKESYLEKLYLYGMLISIPMSVFLAIISPILIPFLLGDAFKESIAVFSMLMLALPVLVIVNLSGLYYSVFKLERFAIVRNLFGLALSLILNAALIPTLGAFGASISVFLSYLFVGYFVEWLLPATRRNAEIKARALILLFSYHTYLELYSYVKFKFFKK
ncbi:flippase [Serratia marcescens]|nr:MULTISPECIES: oligosaccharide flippase family protein [Serratia]KAB5494283.1 oligosaccharide flippase family protein [Enterobacter sp. RJAL6]AUO00615.1 flippase [Serratia marcescens]EMD1302496.1 oligosaccharide flippase family protein [Serratia marcescens]MBH2599883.1 oligosaccharide flippase family protein [Serratia ureilytica]MBH2898026.1 oligosaccharide flippase family protein [Serratia ureilytica]